MQPWRGFQPVAHGAASPAGGERPWDEKSVARRGAVFRLLLGWSRDCVGFLQHKVFTGRLPTKVDRLCFVVFGEIAKWGQSKFS
jgi:hypothetical protein